MDKDYSHRPITFICSPFRGDILSNQMLARRFSRFALTRRVIPIAPHLLFPQFLDDSVPDERELALFMNARIMSFCEQVWVCVPDSITEGMAAELDIADQMGLPIRFFDIDFREVGVR